jgi:hypothetical protein
MTFWGGDLGRGWDVRGIELGERLHSVEDVAELAREALDLGVVEAQAGQAGDVLDVGSSDGHRPEVYRFWPVAQRRRTSATAWRASWTPNTCRR